MFLSVGINGKCRNKKEYDHLYQAVILDVMEGMEPKMLLREVSAVIPSIKDRCLIKLFC